MTGTTDTILWTMTWHNDDEELYMKYTVTGIFSVIYSFCFIGSVLDEVHLPACDSASSANFAVSTD